MNSSERIRYGRTSRHRILTRGLFGKKYTEIIPVPKNTLVTYRDGENIFFGIARCNDKLDTFNKDLGKRIARNRANLTLNIDNVSTYTSVPDTSILVYQDQLRGMVPIVKVKELLDFFNNIDFSQLPERLK